VNKSAILCIAAGALCGTATAGSIGPDVIVGDMPSVQYYGELNGIRAYSIATTSCNIGDEVLEWFDGTNRHPVIGQTIYRVTTDGNRIEQLGQSWLKHGFAALTGNVCDTCQNPGSFSLLGVGCSDPYSSGLNGQQSNLGTKTQVNAFTGFFNWPFGGRGQTGNVIFKRVQIKVDEVNEGGSLYVGSQYVSPDDAEAGNQNNNASFRPVNSFGTGGSLSPTSFTRREQAPIYAWKEVNPDVQIQEVFVPNEGMFNLASLAIDNGDGTWTYEYALHNQTSHRSADSFAVPGSASSTDFRDVDYHSGDAYDLTDWSVTEGGSMVTFAATDVSFDRTNALRWGTMYNFTVTTDTPPTTGDVEIGLYRDANGNQGSNDVIAVTTVVPTAGAQGCNDADNAAPFGVLDLGDVQGFISAFTGQGDAADIAEPFGVWDLADVQAFIGAFTAGCP
jgi:hypothetical protein